MSKKHCPDLISMAECEMSRKKRQSLSFGSCCTARQRQFGLMWNEEEGERLEKTRGNLVWQIDESSFVRGP